MNNTLNKLFIFAAGAAVGSAVTWKLVKTKYEQIAREEIKSVKEVFGRGHRTEANPVDEAAIVEDEEECDATTEEIAEYEKLVDSNGYRNYSTKKNTEREEEEDVDKPYVISPEEFDENDDYEVATLTYYADKVLTDEHDNIIEDVESMVGEDSLNHFGEYEDDSVFVRNDRTKTDYEILADSRRFCEIYR